MRFIQVLQHLIQGRHGFIDCQDVWLLLVETSQSLFHGSNIVQIDLNIHIHITSWCVWSYFVVDDANKLLKLIRGYYLWREYVMWQATITNGIRLHVPDLHLQNNNRVRGEKQLKGTYWIRNCCKTRSLARRSHTTGHGSLESEIDEKFFIATGNCLSRIRIHSEQVWFRRSNSLFQRWKRGELFRGIVVQKRAIANLKRK